MPPIPPVLQVRPIVELRARLERRLQRDFSAAANDGTTDFFGHVRAGVGFSARRFDGQIVYQYADGENYNFNTHVSAFRSDLVLANVHGRLGRSDVTLGRQRLNVGSARLLGTGEWNNVSNAWDGARVAIGRGDVFAVESGLLPTPNETVSLYGGTYDVGPVQGLAVFRHDARNAIDETTLSVQYRRRFGRIALDAEAAGQAGHRGNRRKLAGAFDAIATVPVAPRLTFSVQGSLASGGSDGGTTHTFDQLFPSAHDRHGLLDMAGWQNLRDLGLWLRYDPSSKTSVKLQYHALGLDSARDAWYGSGGARNRRPGGFYVDPTGSHGRDLGQEIDLDAGHSLNVHHAFRAGVGAFRPGGFVRSFNGVATRDQLFGYVQYTYRF